MLIRILSTIAYRLQRKIADHRVRLACIPQGKLTCGSNALIHNHGARANISLGHGVILDGILECYERGRLIVDEFSYVGNSRIFAAERVTIGKGVFISDYVVVYDSNLHPLSGEQRYADMKGWNEGRFPDVYTGIPSQPVHIGDYAWIGALSVIGKGVTIGEGAVIGAGSVVTQDVPPNTVVIQKRSTTCTPLPL